MRKVIIFFMALILTAPAAHAQSWVTNDDYPARARREGREGISYFQLTVSALGAVKDCTITQSSGSADLDDATCDLMKRRARFQPAIGTDGQPKEDIFRSKLVWKLSR